MTFHLANRGAEQAAHFIATIPAGGQSLLHALDVEQMERCPDGRRNANPLTEVRAFLDAAEKHFERRASDLHHAGVLRDLLS